MALALGSWVEYLGASGWQRCQVTRLRPDGSVDVWDTKTQERWYRVPSRKLKGSAAAAARTPKLDVGAQVESSTARGRVVALRADGAVDVAWGHRGKDVEVAVPAASVKPRGARRGASRLDDEEDADEEDAGSRVAVRYTRDDEHFGTLLPRRRENPSIVVGRGAAPGTAVAHRLVRDGGDSSIVDVEYDEGGVERNIDRRRCRVVSDDADADDGAFGDSMHARWCARRGKRGATAAIADAAPRSTLPRGAGVVCLVEGTWRRGIVQRVSAAAVGRGGTPVAATYAITFEDGRAGQHVSAAHVRPFDAHLLDGAGERREDGAGFGGAGRNHSSLPSSDVLQVGSQVMAQRPLSGGAQGSGAGRIAPARIARCHLDGSFDVVFDGERRVYKNVEIAQPDAAPTQPTDRRGKFDDAILKRARRELEALLEGVGAQSALAPLCTQSGRVWHLDKAALRSVLRRRGLALSPEETGRLLQGMGGSADSVDLRLVDVFVRDQDEYEYAAAEYALRSELLRCAARDGSRIDARALFSELDANRRSTLDGTDFDKLLNQVGAHVTAQTRRRLYDALDHDGDGRIGVDDFVGFVRLGNTLGHKDSHRDRLRDTGTADLQATTRESVVYDELQRMDGVLDARGLTSALVDRGWGDLFAGTALVETIDLDGDGEIDATELRAFAARMGRSPTDVERAVNALRRGLAQWLAAPHAAKQLRALEGASDDAASSSRRPDEKALQFSAAVRCARDLSLGLTDAEASIVASCCVESSITLPALARETALWCKKQLSVAEWQHLRTAAALLKAVDDHHAKRTKPSPASNKLCSTEPVWRRLSWSFRPPRAAPEPAIFKVGDCVVTASHQKARIVVCRANARYDVSLEDGTVVRALQRCHLKVDAKQPKIDDALRRDVRSAPTLRAFAPARKDGGGAILSTQGHSGEASFRGRRLCPVDYYAAGSSIVIE
ncbi:hypothetical protein M885DRAFT_613883 [Pelagophyceae sp. CCMP2097]|nr:hypothetical protein M885DRAFT_613883 [Pelagophyceae sp. CCMP2097]